jgi:hypothetical protein
MIVYLQNVLSLEKIRWSSGSEIRVDASVARTPFNRRPIEATAGRGDRVNSLCHGSAERERKSLHARIETLDLQLSISNGLRLSDQLT